MFKKDKKSKIFDTCDEYNWKKVRFIKFNDHLKKFGKVLKKYYKANQTYNEEEKSVGDVLRDRGLSQYDPTFLECDEQQKLILEEEWGQLKEEEEEKYNGLKDLYDCIGSSLERVGQEREQLKMNIEEHLHKPLCDMLEDQKEGFKSNKKYEESLNYIQSKNDRLESLKKTLSKTEKSSQKKKRIKEKEKSKKKEEDIISKISEKSEHLEELKKETALGEKLAVDEMIYQQKKADNDYSQCLREVVLDYRNFFKNCLTIMNGVCSDLEIEKNIELFQPSRRIEETKMDYDKIRTVFKPRRPTRIYGEEIPVIMKRKEQYGHKLPIVVEKMFDFLDNNKSEEGLFRKVGKKEDVDYLIRHIDDNKVEDFSDIQNVHSVGSLLKQYIRILPRSVMRYDKFEAAINAETPEEKLNITLDLFKDENVFDPKCYRYLLYRLLKLLNDCCEYEKENLMNAKSFGLVWGMNIIQVDNQDPMEIMKISPKINEYIEVLVREFRTIFPREPSVEYENEMKDEKNQNSNCGGSESPTTPRGNEKKLQNFGVEEKDVSVKPQTPEKKQTRSPIHRKENSTVDLNLIQRRKVKAPSLPKNNVSTPKLEERKIIPPKSPPPISPRAPKSPIRKPELVRSSSVNKLKTVGNAKRISMGMMRGRGMRGKKLPPRRPLPTLKKSNEK